jgi:nucleotide-binding universal stress UspA family protein
MAAHCRGPVDTGQDSHVQNQKLFLPNLKENDMAIRIILARLTGTATENSVLNGALALAKPFGGHIDALFVTPDPRTAINVADSGMFAGVYESLLSTLEEQAADQTRKIRKQFEKWRETNDVVAGEMMEGAQRPSAQWHEAIGDETQLLTHAARLSDITVMPRPMNRFEDRMDPTLEAALLGTGRPVLLVPRTAHFNLDLSNVLIAWNDSPEAARAVSAAMPLLKVAGKVTVVTAAEGTIDTAAAESLVEYLNKHGVPGMVFRDTRGKSNPVESLLLAAAKKSDANLLVMGAYTHSRLRELVFGGVTRHMLAHAPIPILMSH